MSFILEIIEPWVVKNMHADVNVQLSTFFLDLLKTTNATEMTANTKRAIRYALENELNAKILIISKAIQNKRTSPARPHPRFLKIEPFLLLIHILLISIYCSVSKWPYNARVEVRQQGCRPSREAATRTVC